MTDGNSSAGAATESILLRVDPPVGEIVLNRPDKRNALTLDMWRRLPVLVRELEDNPDVRVVVVRGATPQAFAAGADISEFETMRSTPEATATYNEVVADAEDALAACAKPTIAAVQGFCVGGGCEIAVACDFRFADSSARFGITPARLGIVYPVGATHRLLDLVGLSAAKLLLMSAQLVDATEALRLGLVTRLFETETFDADVAQFAATLAANSIVSMSGAKRLLHLMCSSELSDDIAAKAQQVVADSFGSGDYREGVRAFLERRPPQFGAEVAPR